MTKVVIIGAGGHAQVVADICMRAHESGADHELIGFLEDDPALREATIMGMPILGTVPQLSRIDHDAVIVAIGENRTRACIFESLRVQGERFASAVHPDAVIAPDVRLGQGVMICAGVVANPGTVIGDNVILNTGSTIDHHSQIGPHAHVAPGVHLGGEVRIGEGALVGIGAAIIPGRSVGDWAVIGAGAAVTSDVPSWATAVGVPSRVSKRCRPTR